MADDELSTPLGQNAKKKRRRFKLPIRVPHVIVGALGLFVCAFAGWALMVEDPLARLRVGLFSSARTPLGAARASRVSST